MTGFQRVLVGLGVVAVAGGITLLVITPFRMPGDSPVIVVGGSMTFHSESNWSRVAAVCSPGVHDECAYTSSVATDTSLIRIRGADNTNNPTVGNQPWIAKIFESKDKKYEPSDRYYVEMCTASSLAGDCDTNTGAATRGNFVRIQGKNHGGFNAVGTGTDKKFQHDPTDGGGCQTDNGHHCEEMVEVEMTVGTQKATDAHCAQSKGCRVDIGPAWWRFWPFN